MSVRIAAPPFDRLLRECFWPQPLINHRGEHGIPQGTVLWWTRGLVSIPRNPIILTQLAAVVGAPFGLVVLALLIRLGILVRPFIGIDMLVGLLPIAAVKGRYAAVLSSIGHPQPDAAKTGKVQPHHERTLGSLWSCCRPTHLRRCGTPCPVPPIGVYQMEQNKDDQDVSKVENHLQAETLIRSKTGAVQKSPFHYSPGSTSRRRF